MEIFKFGRCLLDEYFKKLKRVIFLCLENRKGYLIGKCKNNKDGKIVVCRLFL